MAQDEPNNQYLTPKEHIRRRPGMYFGGSNVKAMHRLIYEIVENSINQYLKGNASRVDVKLHEDYKVTVSDNGPGIPITEYKDTGKTIFEIVLSEIGGRSLDIEEVSFRGGLFGVGLGAVNAVSRYFAVTTKRDGFVWHLAYEKGNKQVALTNVRPLNKGEESGTEVTFQPDFEVFERNPFDYEMLTQDLKELSYLLPGFHISIVDLRIPSQDVSQHFYFPDSIAAYVSHLNRHHIGIHKILHQRRKFELKGEGSTRQQIEVEVAFQYIEQPQSIILSFVNLIETDIRSEHVRGLLDAIEHKMSWLARHTGINDDPYNFSEYDVIGGLTAVIHIWHPNPQFEGATRRKLINPDIHQIVRRVVSDMLEETIEQEADTARSILNNLNYG